MKPHYVVLVQYYSFVSKNLHQPTPEMRSEPGLLRRSDVFTCPGWSSEFPVPNCVHLQTLRSQSSSEKQSICQKLKFRKQKNSSSEQSDCDSIQSSHIRSSEFRSGLLRVLVPAAASRWSRSVRKQNSGEPLDFSTAGCGKPVEKWVGRSRLSLRLLFAIVAV